MTNTADSDSTDWGPFGRPIFDDPQAKALSRVGVIDVGSNSVRLVVFDGAARSPAYFFNRIHTLVSIAYTALDANTFHKKVFAFISRLDNNPCLVECQVLT